jgi:hypothetical protein
MHFCKVCKYQTDVKANFTKHLSSQKHKLKEENLQLNEIDVSEEINDTKSIKSQPKNTFKTTESQPKGNPESTSPFCCKYCQQQFKFKQSMYRHIKYSCTKNKTEDLVELVRLLNLQLEQQKNDFETKLQTQSKQIEKLMGKLEINGSFNTHNTNNTNNVNILLNYNETDVSHLTDADYKKCIRRVSRCVMGLIEKVHFNPNKPENMNMYISNIKDKYMMVYQNKKWTLTNKEHLDRVYDDNETLIEQWVEENKDPEMEKFFKRYVNLKKDDKTMQMVTDEIKLLMFNNKNLIKD